MSTTPYHHGNLRQALVEAAVGAVRDRGPDGLALRHLARQVGVSHNAAYRHFSDRGALVDAVAEQALEGLVSAIHRRRDRVEANDPVQRARERLSAIGAGYVDYALAEPGLFRLLFTAYPDAPRAKPDDGDPYELLNVALDDLVAVGYLAAEFRPGSDVMCWSAVHGFAVLHTEGPLRGLSAADREMALQAMLGGIERGLASRPPEQQTR